MLFLYLACAPPQDSAPVNDTQPAGANLVAVYQLDFGAITLGSSRFQEVSVGSQGTETVELIETPTVEEEGVFSVAPIDQLSIPVGEVARFTVTFAPQELGAVVGTVDIESNDANEPIHRIRLTGQGI